MPVEKLGNRVKAHQRYLTADGEQVPGVTTVLGILAKPGLVKWANNLGLRGIDSAKYVDETAIIGGLAHYLVECELQGVEPDLSEYSKLQIDRAENALLSFYEWQKHHAFAARLIEKPLVSERHRYGGTIDAYGVLDGRYCLLDFKTSARIYPEHRIQVSAYLRLLREAGYPVEEVRVLRIGRTEDEGFEEHVLSERELREGWRIFRAALVIYRSLPLLEGRAS
ncbi:MAG: hypothetical protein QJR08_04185 [Bacillota bacterium]|nr:hypothetical protein [Bacillota bacterium]